MSPVDRPVRPEGDDTPRQDVYVYVRPGEIERTREPADGVVVDYATDGSVVGVEVLDVQRVTINNRAASAAPGTSPDAWELRDAQYEIDALEHRVRDLSGLLRGMAHRAAFHRDRANFHMKRADLAEQEDACETCDGTGCDFHGGSADPDSPDHYAPCIDRCGDCYGTGSKSYREGWDEALRAHASAARAATPAETTEH